MVTVGLYVQLEAKAGREDAVAGFLAAALPLAESEPETSAWFALRLTDSTFAIFDAFPNEDGRRAHLDGPIAAALFERAETSSLRRLRFALST